jgi:hypothetical protein
MGTSTTVQELPNCDFCIKTTPALYDGATVGGSWANMCQVHFAMFGIGLGTGRGQKLVVAVKVDNQVPFEVWMAAVNRKLVSISGCDSNDIGDFDYASMYETGTSVTKAADAALDEAGFQ